MSGEKLPYSKSIENHIRECIHGGVSIRECLASMQHMQYAPQSLATLYKIYGETLYGERAKLNGAVGKKVIDQALAGDFKSQELFLRSKAGWSPTQTVEQAEAVDEDVDESAVDTLLTLLGKEDEEQETATPEDNPDNDNQAEDET